MQQVQSQYEELVPQKLTGYAINQMQTIWYQF